MREIEVTHVKPIPNKYEAVLSDAKELAEYWECRAAGAAKLAKRKEKQNCCKKNESDAVTQKNEV
jgi:hypothetical protein